MGRKTRDYALLIRVDDPERHVIWRLLLYWFWYAYVSMKSVAGFDPFVDLVDSSAHRGVLLVSEDGVCAKVIEVLKLLFA